MQKNPVPPITKICSIHFQVNNPAASNGASSLQRYRAAGYVTLAAFSKCLSQPKVDFKQPLGSLLAGISHSNLEVIYLLDCIIIISSFSLIMTTLIDS
jgi:hypothetical protein